MYKLHNKMKKKKKTGVLMVSCMLYLHRAATKLDIKAKIIYDNNNIIAVSIEVFKMPSV